MTRIGRTRRKLHDLLKALNGENSLDMEAVSQSIDEMELELITAKKVEKDLKFNF